MLKADVDVKTPEDAKYEDLQYTHLEIKSLKQRKFDRILEKNRYGSDYSMSEFNKPTAEMVNKTSTTTDVEEKNTNKFKKHENIHSTISLLDKIDNFNYSEESSDSKATISVAQKSTENKQDIFEQLKANEQERQQSSKISDLELNIDKPTTQKQPKRDRKNSKNKQQTIENNSVKSESILEQFKNLDTESILDELSQENENRQYEEEDELDSNYDYEEK